MTMMWETDQRERAVLVGLAPSTRRRSEVEGHLDELARLVDTAGGIEVARMVQERMAVDPATVVGAGFAKRIGEVCRDEGARLVVFDEDLTGSQMRNLEELVPDDVKVVDRAGVILDIFAARARTREARTQVELAQLTYLLPRLTRRWQHLSRQAGGIGTRGVGETQLEIDRRLISRRISRLRKDLKAIESSRRRRRSKRSFAPTVALVGYTNAGKSSLFHRLTQADVGVEDRLFATLDPRARKVALGEDVSAVLTDTVGFIRKLPHHLVAPFRSTLEETAEADLVVHVVDASHPSWEDHLRVGEEVLSDLGVEPAKVVVALNKMDLLDGRLSPGTAGARGDVQISALTGEGLPELRSLLRGLLLAAPDVIVLRIPLAEAELVERALSLPYRLARRFSKDTLSVAVRVTAERLEETRLMPFCVASWGPAPAGAGRRPPGSQGRGEEHADL